MANTLLNPSQFIVVLPAYNEAACLADLIRRIADVFSSADRQWTIIVVDDGSVDETATIAEKAGAEYTVMLLRHGVNQGLGATIRDGLKKASELAAESDIVLTLDADGTHDPMYFAALIAKIEAGADVAIASRYQPGSEVRGVPKNRIMLSDSAGILFRTLLPIRNVKDYTCGFRAYRAGILQMAFAKWGDGFIDQAGFQCMADILLKLRRLDAKMDEIPFTLHYDLKEGASKMRVLRTVKNTLFLIVRRKIGL
jgi:dolichol-phosphate mannosyltransferase